MRSYQFHDSVITKIKTTPHSEVLILFIEFWNRKNSKSKKQTEERTVKEIQFQLTGKITASED